MAQDAQRPAHPAKHIAAGMRRVAASCRAREAGQWNAGHPRLLFVPRQCQVVSIRLKTRKGR
eukprot:5405904-Alexandrium_andersonii.AAC.1